MRQVSRRAIGVLTAAAFLIGSRYLLAQNPPYTEVTPGPDGVTASAHDGNVPGNVVDKSLGTRWSAKGSGQWLTLDMGSTRRVAYVNVAVYRGNTRSNRFELQVSADAFTWETVWSGESSGTTAALETYDFPDVAARYVRYLGYGSSVNKWNRMTEIEIFAVEETRQSEHVYLGDDGRLVYVPYENGDRIPDFSFAGYGGGGVALPTVPTVIMVSPVEGDDGANIQAAIDQVSALTPDADGFRGAVLLTAGTYEVEDGLSIRASGVVLRGEGDHPEGTVIRAVGTSRRTVINISGVGNRTEVTGTRQAITDSYVPVGVFTFTVSDASGFAVGDEVLVVRTPNQEWIDAVGMDDCTTIGTTYDTSDVSGQTCLGGSGVSPWTPGARIMRYERRITAITENEITLDAPTVEAIQDEFGGGYLAKYQFTGRIQKTGVEYLRSESDYGSDTDEQHAVRMISLANVQDAWVRNVTSRFFEQGTVFVGSGSKFVTIQDSASLDHKSLITGGRRYPFSLDDSSFVLVMRCLARSGRHDFVTGSNTPGPNVFLDSQGLDSYSELGPHHRWATGSLFDVIRHESVSRTQIIGAYNRGNSGSGHGWSGAYQLFWNCNGDTHRVASPPYARNWSIGCQALRRQGNGEFEWFGEPVNPASLYLQQLRDRLGDGAVANIGY
jgi:F5/8 type C domain